MQPIYQVIAEELRGNAEQWQAYESKASCVIQAGPGSGKTKTITLKIARMLSEDVKLPRRIACITYSNACVGELRTRLSKLAPEDDRRLLVSTVHSFCLTELVLPYAALAGLAVPDPIVMASPSQSTRLLGEAYKNVFRSDLPKWYRTSFDRLRRSIPDHNSAEWQAAPVRDTAVIEAYESLLLKNGLIDFDGLVLTGLQLVENNQWVRRAICAKYPIVVIDEYQDLGLPLHRIVRALLRGNVRVIAVGDPDQSIYGFTGAKPELLRALATHPKMEAITLRLNYRCGDRIIAASKTLLPSPADYRSHDGSKGEISIYETHKDLAGQATYALSQLLPNILKVNASWAPGDVAFLYRSLHEGTAIAQAADNLGIRYFRLDNGSPIKRSRLTEWLTDAACWCAGGWKTGQIQLSQLLRGWRRMQRSTSREADVLHERERVVTTLFSLRDGALPLHKWLASLRSGFLDKALRGEPDLGDEIDNLEDLASAAEKGGALHAFTVEIFANQGKSPDQINLLTLHSSKGLEFRTVFMLGVERGEFPSGYCKTQADLDEAKRLFYVGVTRAKSQVHLMFNAYESSFITEIRKAI
jgi:ATP-dependent DNA helicase Rep/DNA helicase-2/ATP-dependent DNA helicase PcrA